MKKENKCDHIGIFTNNAKKLVNFYTRKLGFNKEKEEILTKAIVRTAFGVDCDCKFFKLASGMVMIEIFEPLAKRLNKKMDNIVGLNHWGYCVADRKKYVQKLKRKKVKIIEIKRNKHVVYFITDPDGNRIEIRDLKKQVQNWRSHDRKTNHKNR